MTIDPETGLPPVGPDYRWVVREDDYWTKGGLFVLLQEAKRYPGHKVPSGFLGLGTRVIPPSIEWEPVESLYVHDPSKALVLKAAEQIVKKREADAKQRAVIEELVGIYPPKKLEQ